MEKKLNVSILVSLLCILILHQACYGEKNAEQSTLPKEDTIRAMPPQKKKIVPSRYATVKKFLKIGVGIGVAAAGIYVGKDILATKRKEKHITTLFTSNAWQAIKPLSSIYIRNVLYKNNKQMQDAFKQTCAILAKSYPPNYYFPFGYTARQEKVNKQSLFLLNKEDVDHVQSFIKSLFQDFQNDARFLKDLSNKEGLWKRFLNYKISMALFEYFLSEAYTTLSLEEKDLRYAQPTEELNRYLSNAFNKSVKDGFAKEAFDILKIFYHDKNNIYDINQDNFPLIGEKINARYEPPDKEDNY